MAKSLLFDEYPEQQASWIRGQLKANKTDSFNDFNTASKDYDSSLIPLDNAKAIKNFREQHLSKTGIARLKTTLKVYRKRQKDKSTARNLDVTISLEAFQELEKICKNTGLTKKAVIEQLIMNANDPSLFK